MSIIEAIQTYLKSYSNLESGAPVWVDYLGSSPVEYSIQPLPGSIVLESYINGSSLRSYAFAFQSMESTADDLERLGTQGFYEEFAEWMELQTENEHLPTLDSGKTALSIEATGGVICTSRENRQLVYIRYSADWNISKNQQKNQVHKNEV
jgi:hypothetical protein